MTTEPTARHRALALCIAALFLVVGGCGDDEEEATPTTTTTQPSTTGTTVAPTTTTASTTSTQPTTEPTTSTVEETSTVLVFFSSGSGTDCAEVRAFERSVAVAEDPIDGAFATLLEGPTAAELGDGDVGSFFSHGTAGMLRSTQLDGGSLVVDLEDLRGVIPNASTSCGSEALLAQLTATAFQFVEVERVRFDIDGSCDAFSNWLQRGCTAYTRDGASPVDLSLEERAHGSGCSPGGDVMPDGRWFGYVEEASAGEISFDLACWFTGEAAAEAATEDGEESPPPNDFHVRNADDLLRAVPVAVDAEAEWMANTSDPATVVRGAYEEWLTARRGRDVQAGVWLHVVDDEVVLVEEQYVP